MDAAQLAALALLHDHAHGLGKALVFALHLLKELQSRGCRLQRERQLRRLLFQAVALFRACLTAQSVALDRVITGSDLLLRLGKCLACSVKVRLRV